MAPTDPAVLAGSIMGNESPHTYGMVKSRVGLSTWFRFYVRRQVIWISVMRSGNNLKIMILKEEGGSDYWLTRDPQQTTYATS